MTHCRKCGVLESVGDSVICEDCADNLDPLSAADYYSWYDLKCAMLVLGLGIAALDIGIVVFWTVLSL